MTLYILHFLNDGFKSIYITLLPFVSKDLHLSFTQVGVLGAASGVLLLALAVPFGIIISKVGGIKLLFLTLLFYSLCAFGIGFSYNFISLVLFFYLGAVAFAPFHIAGNSITARVSPKEKIGSIMGTFSVSGDLGRIALPTIALFIVTFIGWRNTYIYAALFGILVLVILLWSIRNKKHILQNIHSSDSEENTKRWLKKMLSTMRKKQFILIVLAGMLDGFGGSSILIYLPFLLLSKQIPASLLALFMGGYFAGSLFGKKFLSKGTDTFGPSKIFILAELCMATLMILLTATHQSFFLFILSFILGIFTRGTIPVIATLLSTVSHTDHYEKTYAISELFFGISATLAPILLGRVADSSGINLSFYVAAVFALLAVIPIYLYTKTNKLSTFRISENEQAIE